MIFMQFGFRWKAQRIEAAQWWREAQLCLPVQVGLFCFFFLFFWWVSLFLLLLVLYVQLFPSLPQWEVPHKTTKISLCAAGVTLSFSIYLYLLLQKVHLIYVSTIAQKEGKTFPKTFTADQSVQKCGCCSSSFCKREEFCCNNISKFCKKAIMLR